MLAGGLGNVRPALVHKAQQARTLIRRQMLDFILRAVANRAEAD